MEAPDERRVINWKAVGALATVAGVLVALASFVVENLDAPANPPVTPTTTPSHEPDIPSPPSVTAREQPLPGTCVDSTGRPADCAQEDTGLVVAFNQCDIAQVLNFLAVDPARQLDLSANRIVAICALFPGHKAAAAGATGLDIMKLASGDTVAKLAVCYSGDQGPEVVCSQRHFIEAVGDSDLR